MMKNIKNKNFLILLPILFLTVFILLFCLNTNAEVINSNIKLNTIGPILYPLPTLPAIVKRGTCFNIQYGGEMWKEVKKQEQGYKLQPLVQDWQADVNIENASLLLFEKEFPIDIKGIKYDSNQEIWLAKTCIPSQTPIELYDIVLNTKEGKFTSKRSVKVVAEFRKDFYFIHITDVHIGFPGNYIEQGFHTSSELFKKAAEEINVINPEFVLITGDIMHTVVDNSVLHNQIFGSSTEDEAKEFLEILNTFRAPTYVLPGNHDMVGIVDKQIKDFWKNYIGRRYFSFDYGNYHFTGLDNSSMMEATAFLYKLKDFNQELDEEQLEWLEKDLAEHKKSTLKILFYHVPLFGMTKVKSRLPEIFRQHNVALTLAGHYHRDFVEKLPTYPILWIETESMLDYGSYRLIRIKDKKIESWAAPTDMSPKPKQLSMGDFMKLKTATKGLPQYSLSAYNFDVQYKPSNAGSSDTITAEITNKLSEKFENALVKFTLPLKTKIVEVENGRQYQCIDGMQTKICYVETSIDPTSTNSVVLKRLLD